MTIQGILDAFIQAGAAGSRGGSPGRAAQHSSIGQHGNQLHHGAEGVNDGLEALLQHGGFLIACGLDLHRAERESHFLALAQRTRILIVSAHVSKYGDRDRGLALVAIGSQRSKDHPNQRRFMTTSMVRRNGTGPMQRQQTAAPAGGTIEALLQKHGPEIALVLPEHVTCERLMRIALSEVRRNPRLGQCNAASLLGAIFTCAQLGLEPGGTLGHAYLIPYRDECQFQIGYKGMIELARRSGKIQTISARCVYQNDSFDYSFGLNEDLVHRPANGERGELTHAYAVAKLKDGGVQFEVMDRLELEDVRDGSQGYQTAIKYNKTDTPWISSFDEMCRKTVIRRLFKYLPVSVEIAKAASLDEAADRGQRQETDLDHLLLPAEAPAPAIAAAAAPVATLTEQQQQQLLQALSRQLTPVGHAAFLADACAAFGAADLAGIPAEHHSKLMGGLANAGSRERWNRGCASGDGKPILTAEQIAELTPQEVPQGAPAQPQRPATRTVRRPAAAAPAPEPEAPAAEAEEGAADADADADDLQGELV